MNDKISLKDLHIAIDKMLAQRGRIAVVSQLLELGATLEQSPTEAKITRIASKLAHQLESALPLIQVLSSLLCRQGVLSADTLAELAGQPVEEILDAANLVEGVEAFDPKTVA
jgi:uncharacterized protein HemY